MATLAFCISKSHSLKLEAPARRFCSRILAAQLRIGALLTLAVVVFTGKPSYTQQKITQEQVVRDPQALTLLQQAWNLMGGSAWSSAGSVQLSGTLDHYHGKQRNGDFSLTVDRSGNTNTTMRDEQGNMTNYSLNGHSLTASLPGKSQQTQPLQSTLSVPSYFPLELIHRALNDSSWAIVSLGTSTVNSTTCTEIEIKHVYPISNDRNQIQSKFTIRHVYIDTQTGLIDRIANTAYAATNVRITEPRTLDYANYQQLGPYFLPSSVTDKIDGQTILHMNVTAAN